VDLDEFAQRAGATDHTQDPDRGLQIVLHGLAGEAGSVVSEAKKWFRDGGPPAGLADRVEEELGDLLWYVAAVANRLGLELNVVADRSLHKAAQTFRQDVPPPAQYDEGWPESQRLPRRMAIRFVEDDSGPVTVVKMEPLGELAERVARERERKQLGDTLDDNLAVDDGYRYHDIIHLAHAAVLGWSPVVRALLGAKRKGPPPLGVAEKVDRTQDGARAIALEEGLAAFVFNFLEPDEFEASDDMLTWDLIKHVHRSVRGLEVDDQPPVAWRYAYRQAFACFRLLRDAHGGTIEVDLDAQTLTVLGGD
jgi:NTP pyrophosphatase (non-canonical NTP hydrolase)